MSMTKSAFNAMLRRAGLSKKEFAAKTGYAYATVAGWGGPDKPVPSWVMSWLLNYRKARTLDGVKDVICSEESPKGE